MCRLQQNAPVIGLSTAKKRRMRADRLAIKQSQCHSIHLVRMLDNMGVPQCEDKGPSGDFTNLGGLNVNNVVPGPVAPVASGGLECLHDSVWDPFTAFTEVCSWCGENANSALRLEAEPFVPIALSTLTTIVLGLAL